MRNQAVTLCQNCNKLQTDHTWKEASECKNIINSPKCKRNWTEEYQKRRVAWFNAIPEKGCITEQDHKQLFPYGPSIYRDTKKDALNVYKQFIIHNQVASTYARDTTVQEKLV